MDESKQPGLEFAQIFLTSVHFEHRKDALSHVPDTHIDLDVGVTVKVMVSEDGSKGIITLGVKTDDAKDPLYRFHLEMTALVKADAAAPNLSPEDYLTNQGPAAMYPFLREAVANLTARGRFGPVWLKPLNLRAASRAAESKTDPA